MSQEKKKAAAPEETVQSAAPEKKRKSTTAKKPAGKKPKKGSDPRKAFMDAFGQLTCRHRAWNVWHDFIIMFACTLSNPLDTGNREKREALYLKTIKKYNKQEQEIFPELIVQTILALEENPEQDFLGSIFMSLDFGDSHNGQFFTPYSVCELMAGVSTDDAVQKVERDGYILINDPCCGAGATLIAGIHAIRKQLEKANLNYQLYILAAAQDIDEITALMCYIQLTLLGVAGYVKVGDSLTEPITDGDNRENYWFTPMYFSNVWVLRRIFGGH